MARTAKLLDPSSVKLRRPGAGIGAERAGHPGLQRALLAQRRRFGCLVVERGCDARRAALVGDASHEDGPPKLADLHLDGVSGPYVP